MKTQNNLQLVTESELLKAIALKKHLGDDFFIIESDSKTFIFDGNEEEARHKWTQATSEPADNIPFDEWCIDNLTEVEPYDEDNYNNDYLVLTDEEADEKATEYIKSSLWAFNASFLACGCGVDVEVFEAIQNNDKCESNNDAIESLVDRLWSIDELVQDAISADGRGHYMSSYDGKENEETVNGTTFYIYRQN